MFRFSLPAVLLSIYLACPAPSWADEKGVPFPLKGPMPENLLTARARLTRLAVTLTERGTVVAVDPLIITCPGRDPLVVKSATRLGRAVKKGDLLVELDDAPLRGRLRTQQAALMRARQAREEAAKRFQAIKAEYDAKLSYAEVDFEKAQERSKEYEQSSAAIRKKYRVLLEKARSDVERERLRTRELAELLKLSRLPAQQDGEADLDAWKKRVQKGIRPKPTDPSKKAELERQREQEQHVLRTMITQETQKELKAAVVRARLRRDTLTRKAEARVGAAAAAEETARVAYRKQVARLKELKEAVKACRITAPRDGIVVAPSPEIGRLFLERGETVCKGQKLLALADSARLAVRVKVHEDMIAPIKKGQKVVVRTESTPGRKLTGRVQRVLPPSSPSEVKVHTVVVLLEGTLAGVKPDSAVTATFSLNEGRKQVLAVPLAAIVGGKGNTARCVVRTPAGLEVRQVVVGERTEKLAEVRSGLREGEEVVIDGSVTSLLRKRPSKQP